MLIRLMFALVLVVGLLWLISRLSKSTPEQRQKFLKLLLLYGGVGILIGMIVTGRLHWLFAGIGFLIPWIRRGILAQRAFDQFKRWSGPQQDQNSDVETRYLRMALDHDSGDMSGVVLEGAFRGRSLQELSVSELMTLRAECEQHDAQSVAVLDAYLDRTHGDHWREHASGTNEGSDDAKMTAEQAYEVLGLTPQATRDEIIEAHRRLIQKLHPDRGGPTYLAAKINQAKDRLLRA